MNLIIKLKTVNMLLIFMTQGINTLRETSKLKFL